MFLQIRRSKYIVFGAILTMLGCFSVSAQTTDSIPKTASKLPEIAKDDTLRLESKSLVKTMGIETDFVDDTIALLHHLSRQTLSYPQLADYCKNYRIKVLDVIDRLAASGIVRDGKLWINDTTCYNDYPIYRSKLVALTDMLQRQESRFTQLEVQRIEEERRAEEERKRREAKRRLDEANDKMATLKSSIASQHADIENICMASGITDKSKIKELKEIRYSYLPIYNRYDLVSNNSSDEALALLEELNNFQHSLLDSVLGVNSICSQICNFADGLRIRAGKTHSDVYKSYQKVFKNRVIPTSFNSLQDYSLYMRNLCDVVVVQNRYDTVIELRNLIAANTLAIQNRCGKKFKEVWSAYKSVLDATDLTPAFSSVAESDKFIGYLDDFIQVQAQYLNSVDRIESIYQRNDSILALCDKRIRDVSDAFNALIDMQNETIIPSFKTMPGAEFFNAALDNFEKLQSAYVEVVGLRLIIAQKADSIRSMKHAPKGLVAAYKGCCGRVNLTPNFSNEEKSLLFVNMLDAHIVLQDKFIMAINNNVLISQNEQRIKTQTKGLSHIAKAYNRLMKTYDLMVTINTDTDVDKYLFRQTTVLNIQNRVIEIAAGAENKSVDSILKNEKNTDHIKLAFGIK